MGNRANVIFVSKTGKEVSPCIYLHWNGGPESIYAFLDELDRRQVRADQNYECARFIQIVAEFFDGDKQYSTLSLGVVNGPKRINEKNLQKLRTDPGDNGFYVVCREDGKRTVRRFITEYIKNPKAKFGADCIFKEMSAEDVEKERVEAYKHDYMSFIPEAFRTFQRERKVAEDVE